MATNLRKLTQLSAWKPRARERALLAAMISGPLALLVALIVGALVVATVANTPKPVNTYTAISSAQKAQNYARNALLLWLSGSKPAEKVLLSRNTAEQVVNLSDNGFEVFTIDPVDIERHQGSDAVEWVVTLSATLVSPGAAAPQVNRFSVTVLEHEGNYQLLTWPMIVNADNQSFTVTSKYTVPVERTSPLGQAMQRFVTPRGRLPRGASTCRRSSPEPRSPTVPTARRTSTRSRPWRAARSRPPPSPERSSVFWSERKRLPRWAPGQ